MRPWVQDNSGNPKMVECRIMELMSSAADAISSGDLVDSMIFG